jgi:SAM-dependent methyltransferase
MSDPRTALVGRGYDERVATWESWRARVRDDPRDDWCDELLMRLPEDARVVELGCGSGTEETQRLAGRFHVTGVDLSTEQLRLARARVPQATFVHADFTQATFERASFDAVAAFYVFNHVPRELLPPLLRRIHGWLAPGGLLLTAFGTSDTEAWTGEWLGAETFFSSFPPETNRRLLGDAGFELLRDELVQITEPEGAVEFQWVLARR